MSRSMIKQQNSGATAHVVLYTPRQSTKTVSNKSILVVVFVWISVLYNLSLVLIDFRIPFVIHLDFL